jgi:uncharacterized membrane protein
MEKQATIEAHDYRIGQDCNRRGAWQRDFVSEADRVQRPSMSCVGDFMACPSKGKNNTTVTLAWSEGNKLVSFETMTMNDNDNQSDLSCFWFVSGRLLMKPFVALLFIIFAYSSSSEGNSLSSFNILSGRSFLSSYSCSDFIRDYPHVKKAIDDKQSECCIGQFTDIKECIGFFCQLWENASYEKADKYIEELKRMTCYEFREAYNPGCCFVGPESNPKQTLLNTLLYRLHTLLGVLPIAILVGLIPAVIARRKGRSFFAWWIYGAALFLVALPHALLIKRDYASIEERQMQEGMKKCPFCAEMIKSEAKVCRYCGREITSDKKEEMKE